MPARRTLPLLTLLVAAAPTTQQVRYAIEPGTSDVAARVAFFGLASKTARFPKVSGGITLDPARPAAVDLAIELDARSLTAPDPVTLRRLKSKKFFWVERYPTIRFTGERLVLTGPATGSVAGEITARGVTRPAVVAVVFSTPPAQANGHEPLTVTARTTIDRRAFGMTAYPMIVGNKVAITVRAKMVPAG